MMSRLLLSGGSATLAQWLLGLLSLLALDADPGIAQDRRNWATPGLVLETGARHATCDVLRFTPSGDQLLAAGDDKVVRVWDVGKDTLHARSARTLRWPSFRERRGSIYALDLSPNDGSRRIAVAGCGLINGMVVILDRTTGTTLAAMGRPLSDQVTWSIAWSPDGRYTVHGSEWGELFRWAPASKAPSPVRIAGPGKPGISNPVRLVAFLDSTRFLAVTASGQIWQGDVATPDTPAVQVGSFAGGQLVQVVLSPNKRWLAACTDRTNDVKVREARQVELIDLRTLRPRQRARRIFLAVPQGKCVDRFPWSLAFDESGEKLAVGTREAAAVHTANPNFNRVTGGRVFVWSLADTGTSPLLTPNGLNIGYSTEAVAFRPGSPGQLATAGGPNHEVRLWDYRRGIVLSTIVSPGNCLWSVALSKDGKYLGWKDEFNPAYEEPNDRGAGPWRVFALDPKKPGIQPGVPRGFVPHQPIPHLDDWKLVPTTDPYIWRVLGPGGLAVDLDQESGLYPRRVYQIPRCWTFLPAVDDAPPRLAVGHMWGISLYELHPRGVKLARVMVGHVGEVMAVAPAPGGRLLLSAGRDQTIACWSLADWPGQAELGMRVVREGERLTAAAVAPGSPAWEAGLTDGDEIEVVVITEPTGRAQYYYESTPRFHPHPRTGRMEVTVTRDRHPIFLIPGAQKLSAQQMLVRLQLGEPSRQYVFVWRHRGEELSQYTTVRQRPLWQFFATQKGDWVLWRWRDYYYDTNSAAADRLMGWQLNRQRHDETPAFYPLEQLRGTVSDDPSGKPRAASRGFHDPAKVWTTVRTALPSPEKVLFPDLEPPQVRLSLIQKPGPKTRLILDAVVQPRPGNTDRKQQVTRVSLWLGDSLVRTDRLEPVKGQVQTRLEIDPARLRNGTNEFTLVAFNAAGARAEHRVTLEFHDPTRPRPRLFGLCVGVNDYSRLKGAHARDLRCPKNDAAELAAVLRQHRSSALYGETNVVELLDSRATASNILGSLEKLAGLARPDDWLVVFLAGHGLAREAIGGMDPGSFYFVCADSRLSDPRTVVTAAQLRGVLAEARCHKLILLDACHSGAAGSPERDLNSNGARFLIFSACRGDQQAWEPPDEDFFRTLKLTPQQVQQRHGLDVRHGIFTQSLLAALGDSRTKGASTRRQVLTSRDIVEEMSRGMAARMERLRVLQAIGAEDQQHPVFEPDPRDGGLLERIRMLCRP